MSKDIYVFAEQRDGNIQKVASGIFLLAPYNVGIMGDFKDELKKGFPWSY